MMKQFGFPCSLVQKVELAWSQVRNNHWPSVNHSMVKVVFDEETIRSSWVWREEGRLRGPTLIGRSKDSSRFLGIYWLSLSLLLNLRFSIDRGHNDLQCHSPNPALHAETLRRQTTPTFWAPSVTYLPPLQRDARVVLWSDQRFMTVYQRLWFPRMQEIQSSSWCGKRSCGNSWKLSSNGGRGVLRCSIFLFKQVSWFINFYSGSQNTFFVSLHLALFRLVFGYPQAEYIKDTYCPWPSLRTGIPTSGNSISHASFNVVEKWLQDCTQNHRACGSNSKTTLPARVLDLQSAEPDLILCEPKNKNAKYICLSHCWGNSRGLTTTLENVEIFRDSISFGDLPRTFQEAVIFTKKLGIQYLWIDSL